MKIILLQDIKNLGRTGDIKEVADGYARNLLLPKKLAEIATHEAVEKIKKEKETAQKTEAKLLEDLKKRAGEISDKEITIKAKEKGGKLFGSIGKREIAEKLGSGVIEDMIELKENIKGIGVKNVIINFGNNIKAKITVNVRGE